MEAMEYEILIRKIYNSSRSSKNGADADIYRRMERAERHLNDPNWGKSNVQKENDFREAFVTVRSNVQKALQEGYEQIQHRAAADETALLESMISKLRDINFYNKKELDKMIKDAMHIFHKYGMMPS
jgi:hypothetical protein